jgi:hypothetical protein
MRTFFQTRFADRRGASALAVVLRLFLTCSAARAVAEEALREWSDAAGRHKLTAKLQASSDGAVTLEMADGKLMEIQFTKLSENDRKYVNTHRENLKKPDDNPFKDKNAAKIEKLETRIKAAQREIDEAARAARENADKVNDLERKLDSKIEECRSEVADVARQLFYVNLRAAAARLDALLLDQQLSKLEVSCLEEQIKSVELAYKIADARYQNGRTSVADVLEVKAGLCMYKGCLAWVKGELKQCQKEYDDAVAASKEHVKIVEAQNRVGNVDTTILCAAQAAAKDAELRASRVKERIAAREAQGKKL